MPMCVSFFFTLLCMVIDWNHVGTNSYKFFIFFLLGAKMFICGLQSNLYFFCRVISHVTTGLAFLCTSVSVISIFYF